MGRDDLKLLKLRGAHLLPDGRIALPSPCSALKSGQCSIYPDRPIACHVFKVGSKDCLAARKLEGY